MVGSHSGPLGEVPGLRWDEKRQRYFSVNRTTAETDTSCSGLAVRRHTDREEPPIKELPVDDAVMATLREVGFKRKRRRGASVTDMQPSECSICLEALQHGERILELPSCKHVFHKRCLTPWMKQRGSCPSCRAAVDVAFQTAQAAAIADTKQGLD